MLEEARAKGIAMDSDIYGKLKALKEKLVSQIVAGDVYAGFDGKTVNLGLERSKNLTLRIPTSKGVAVATVNYDPNLPAGDLYALLVALGLKADCFKIVFGTGDGMSVLEAYDTISTYHLEEGQVFTVALALKGGAPKKKKHLALTTAFDKTKFQEAFDYSLQISNAQTYDVRVALAELSVEELECPKALLTKTKDDTTNVKVRLARFAEHLLPFKALKETADRTSTSMDEFHAIVAKLRQAEGLREMIVEIMAVKKATASMPAPMATRSTSSGRPPPLQNRLGYAPKSLRVCSKNCLL